MRLILNRVLSSPQKRISNLMDRAVRLSLFALGIFLGSALIVFTSTSNDESGEELALAKAGSDPPMLVDLTQAHSVTMPLDVNRQAPSEDEERLDDDQIEARGRAESKQRAEDITAALAREAVDPAWGPAMEQQIADRFAANAPPGVTLVSTTCKTSLCMAEVESPPDDGSTKQIRWRQLFKFSRTYIYRPGDEADEGEAFRTFVFVARDGHDFPE